MVFRLLAGLLLWLAGFVAPAAGAQVIHGVGSSFPVNLYEAWARVYEKQTGVRFEYKATGTSRGTALFEQGEATFLSLNRPLSEKRVVDQALLQFPVVMGGTVPVVNISGIRGGQLRLSGPVLADIFLGKIVRWNDPAIRELNPRIFLPPTPITVISRGDASGTTLLLDRFLGSVSPQWRSYMDALPFVKIPVGPRPEGIEDLTRTLLRVPNSISYVDYAFAKRMRLAHVSLRNASGRFVSPTYASIQAAARGPHWAGAMAKLTTNSEDPEAWPIASPSFGVLKINHESADAVANALQALDFFNWARRNGDQIADDHDYVPLPAEVKSQVEAALMKRLVEAGAAAR